MASQNTLICPNCKKNIEITEALLHDFQEELEGKYKKEKEEAIKEAEEKAKKEIAEKNNTELEELKKQLTEQKEKNEEFQKQELKLREEKRKLEERERQIELEAQRKFDEERKKFREELLKEEAEKQRYKMLEYEKQISDLKQSLEDAQRKANQGSQQSQGEIVELDLEQTLSETFSTDKVEPVEKGIKGADIRQTVKTSHGNVCGVILWETKRTKAWTDKWIEKLKKDTRAEGANISVIVSSELPSEAKSGLGFKDGVWVVSFNLIIPLAQALRDRLYDTARERFNAQTKGSVAESVYDYIKSHEFRQQVEAMVEAYQEMKQQIEKERRAYERIWTSREAQIDKLFTSTSKIYGSLEGRVGKSMPTVKGLDLLGEGDNEDEK